MDTTRLLEAPVRPESLSAAIVSVLSDCPSRLAVRQLIERCHRIAIAYLLRKVRRGGFSAGLFGISIEDLALDSIAELFRRDDAGIFPVLRLYFKGMAGSASAADLDIAVRRIVFSKVNECLFRRYQEADPNLARLIRNVKDAAKSADELHLVRHHTQLWLIVTPEPGRETPRQPLPLPLAPPEVLESFFTARLKQHTSVDELLRSFIGFVAAHPHYTNGYPVAALSQVLRAAFVRTESASASVAVEPSAFADFDLQRSIHFAAEQLGRKKRPSYVGRGKVSADIFDSYIEAIEAVLTAEFVTGDGAESYYEVLRERLPGLSEEKYARSHRNVFEYLVKLARAQFLDQLREAA